METHFKLNFPLLIRDLICEYDCIVIPNFGGLVSYYESALILEDKNLILPPHKRISFNINLSKNDGLLAQEIVLKCGVSYEVAIQIIQEEVKQWNKILNQEQILELNSIGNFRKSKEGNLIFEEDRQQNHSSYSYGLTAIHALPLEKDGLSGKLMKEFENRKSTPNYKRKLKKYTLASSLALFFIALMVWTGFNQNLIQQKASELNLFWNTSVNNQKENTNRNPIKEKENVLKVQSLPLLDSIQNKPIDSTMVVQMETLEKTTDLSTEIEISTNTSKELSQNDAKNLESQKYIIVAGCFQSFENAQKYIETLKIEGFTPFLAGTSEQGLYRVAYDSFNDMQSAENFLPNIRSKHNPSAWICLIQ